MDLNYNNPFSSRSITCLTLQPRITLEEVVNLALSKSSQPTKTANAFFIYRMNYIKQLNLNNTKYNMTELSPLIGAAWRNEPSDIRQVYFDIAKAADHNYKKIVSYRMANQQPSQLQKLPLQSFPLPPSQLQQFPQLSIVSETLFSHNTASSSTNFDSQLEPEGFFFPGQQQFPQSSNVSETLFSHNAVSSSTNFDTVLNTDQEISGIINQKSYDFIINAYNNNKIDYKPIIIQHLSELENTRAEFLRLLES
ncbi:6956_t:CDS:1 [Ambispora gerdemannii]|uniref:6956_t:CDS:1 n=1 Tax=Ambispora gerdemannii TaxID=144530 RepID=A0A9N9BVM5_9GLOM|nr:6956_t:CDS:1 [Ambispora gerdemannii]